MRVLVVYYSETGNTKKVAGAIYEEASKEHEADLKRVEEITVDVLDDYDVVFLGSACHSADLARPAKRILNVIPKSPRFKLAGFFTHATYTSGESQSQNTLFTRWASKCITSFQEKSKEKQIDFKGYFNCQGAPSPSIKEFIRREVVTSPGAWEEYIEEVMKHPTPEDLQKAREFAREIISEAQA